MEIFLLLIVIVLVVILIGKLNTYSKNFSDLESKLNSIQKDLATKSSPTSIEKIKEPTTVVTPVVEVKKPDPQITPPVPDKPFHPEEVNKVPERKTLQEEIKTPKEQPAKDVVRFEIEKPKETVKTPASFSVEKEPVVIQNHKSWYEKFKENNPDIEKFIGENLINKIGILILVLGVSFFVKYAIDKDWISEPFRVAIGILCGVIVMGVAHRLRENYKAFSSVFVAGAISIFYLTIAIAFHDYQLFSQPVAFIIMCVITIFSAFVSVGYDRKELAILSLIGGFAVPFMVSTGQGNYKVLFSYIAILDIGIIIISYFKKWNVVTLLAFIFTNILFIAWFVDGNIHYGHTSSGETTFVDNSAGAMIFATLFYFIFSIAAVINNIRNKGVFSPMEYFIILGNTLIYFFCGLYIINGWVPNYKGLFTVTLALYNLIYAFLLYKKFGVNKTAIYLLLGLTLTFVTLAVPIQFKGNYITLFWAGEAVLLFWMAQKSRMQGFKLGAIIVQILMLGSLFMDWGHYLQSFYSEEPHFKIVINPTFITGVVVIISFIISIGILKKEKTPVKIYDFTFVPSDYIRILKVIVIILTYLAGVLEINYQSSYYITNSISAESFVVLYHYLFTTILLYFMAKSLKSTANILAIFLCAGNIASYILLFHTFPKAELIENISGNKEYYYHYAFYFHYIIVACVLYALFYIVGKIRNTSPEYKILNLKTIPWILAACFVYILSNELMIHGIILNRHFIEQSGQLTRTLDLYERENIVTDIISDIKTQIIKIGFPILWGVLAFAFLIFGIRRNWKELRIIALSLLGITIVKLFVYDINDVSETGKIIAFILLGVLILIISFVYQKIKRLVVDEYTKNENEKTS